MAREIDNNPDLLIAAQPTRGLDVGAIEIIHKYIVEQRDKGKAVLLISFELDEVMDLSDRIAVIYKGAWDKSSRPFKNALFVNSPFSARSAPFSRHKFKTLLRHTMPP